MEQALEHPYLTALHDPMVEPASEPAPFEFEFEDEELQEEQLREKVWEEMLSFHGEGSLGGKRIGCYTDDELSRRIAGGYNIIHRLARCEHKADMG